jgi:hypothetical protein
VLDFLSTLLILNGAQHGIALRQPRLLQKDVRAARETAEEASTFEKILFSRARWEDYR